MSERQKTAPKARGRRFYHVFEAAHTVYKYAPNKFSFWAQIKNFVILRVSKDLVETKRQTFFAPAPQLLIELTAILRCLTKLCERVQTDE